MDESAEVEASCVTCSKTKEQAKLMTDIGNKVIDGVLIPRLITKYGKIPCEGSHLCIACYKWIQSLHTSYTTFTGLCQHTYRDRLQRLALKTINSQSISCRNSTKRSVSETLSCVSDICAQKGQQVSTGNQDRNSIAGNDAGQMAGSISEEGSLGIDFDDDVYPVRVCGSYNEHRVDSDCDNITEVANNRANHVYNDECPSNDNLPLDVYPITSLLEKDDLSRSEENAFVPNEHDEERRLLVEADCENGIVDKSCTLRNSLESTWVVDGIDNSSEHSQVCGGEDSKQTDIYIMEEQQEQHNEGRDSSGDENRSSSNDTVHEDVVEKQKNTIEVKQQHMQSDLQNFFGGFSELYGSDNQDISDYWEVCSSENPHFGECTEENSKQNGSEKLYKESEDIPENFVCYGNKNGAIRHENSEGYDREIQDLTDENFQNYSDFCDDEDFGGGSLDIDERPKNCYKLNHDGVQADNKDPEHCSNSAVPVQNYAFICGRCNKEIHGYNMLQRHWLTHGVLYYMQRSDDAPSPLRPSNSQLYQCPKCEKLFFTYTASKRHASSYHPPGGKKYTTMFVCQSCALRFNQEEKYVPHWLKHMQFTAVDNKQTSASAIRSSFLCCYCGKVLKSQRSLDKHQQSHELGKKFLCKYCPDGFDKTMQRQEHYLLKHGDKFQVMRDLCPVCGKLFLKQYLPEHIKRHRLECKQCKSIFATLEALGEHNAEFHSVNTDQPSTSTHDNPGYVVDQPAEFHIVNTDQASTSTRNDPGYVVDQPAEFHSVNTDQASTSTRNDPGYVVDQPAEDNESSIGPIRQWMCLKCSKSFRFRGMLAVHVRSHNR